jgi:hypothetical protein
MEKYGKIYDNSLLTNTSEIQELICDYFDNPIMTKIKNTDNQTIYMAKIKTLLLNKQRYLVASVPLNKFNIGDKKNLQNLNWQSFQTRTLDNNYNIEKHTYQVNYKNLKQTISIVNRNDKITEYICNELNIKIYLIHKKKNNLYEYSDKGNLKAALETYNTIITI